MIIDLILDRKDGEAYSPREFYNAVMGYGKVGHLITEMMDEGTELDVKAALCRYIVDNGYNEKICEYVISVNWLEGYEDI
jgi:hypothetical protein